MTVDLTQFHGAFFEESFEALDTMEAALLKLDVGAPEPELINTIFRVAHSIKGGSATFGFTEIASFTHSLETLLDELRSGTMPVTVPLSDLLLKSVDVMRAMLRAVQAKQPIDAQRISDLQFDLEVAIAKKEQAVPTAIPGGRAPGPVVHDRAFAASQLTQSGLAPDPPPHWRIHFHPFRELLARGNDPLRMLRELAELGELSARVDAQMLPPLADVNPQDCYLAWSLELSGEASEEGIRQVFEWAEGDCDLTLERLPAPPAASAAAAPTATATELVQRGEAAESPAMPAGRSPPAATSPRTEGPAKPEPTVSGHGDSGSIRVSVEKIDELMNTVGELVITQAMLSQLGAHFEGADAEKLRAGLAQLERNMRELQESVMRVRMLPISFVFSRFPRMVRDLAQRLGKQIELKLTGEQTELDKTVLEKIGDPLVHLVRNCLDHGIESPDARSAAGKPAAGTVHLDACHRGGNIAVEVSDDGGGLDRERILAKARARGLIGASEPLTDAEIHELIFLPGFSTAEKTTDVSGRGVGMDVVRRNVKELGGKIEVRSEPGRGSRFTITLPLTLAIVDGQSVAVGTETYIVPLISIVESMQLKASGVTRLSGHSEVLSFRGDYLPIIRLHELFGVEPRARALHEGLVVVAEGEGRRIGLFVDDLLGQQQVVIKSLETNYGHIEGVSGATILGDGSVALILDVSGLIRAASLRAAA
ncbi:MAG TPA: chemotaxis protein CheA [Steroidobacteraceae bacterium]|nr:chemotaxis protein CheA [Steroidobacteraceae bacterium]